MGQTDFALQRAGAIILKPWLWEKHFHRRLTNPTTRNKEIRSLELIGPAAVPVLMPLAEKPDPGSPALSEAAVETLGRIGGPEATNSLLRVLQSQEREALRDRRVRLPVMFAVLLATLPVLVGLGLLSGSFDSLSDSAWVFALVPTWFAFRAIAGVRRSAANALGALQETRAAGALAMAYRDKNMRDVAGPILTALLPRVGPDEVETWAADERAACLGLLTSGNTELQRAALPLVALYAGSEALPLVEELARSENEEVARAAEQALGPIRQRDEAQRDRITLLRSASDAVDTEQLLRPALGDDTPSDNLLIARGSEEEGSP